MSVIMSSPRSFPLMSLGQTSCPSLYLIKYTSSLEGEVKNWERDKSQVSLGRIESRRHVSPWWVQIGVRLGDTSCAMSVSGLQCRTIPYHAISHHTIPCNVSPYHTLQWRTKPCNVPVSLAGCSRSRNPLHQMGVPSKPHLSVRLSGLIWFHTTPDWLNKGGLSHGLKIQAYFRRYVLQIGSPAILAKVSPRIAEFRNC